ncbi:MAG: hypothetical protein ACFFDW_16745, partial [Candidatus Thorarchaeota archaeon]
MRKITERNPERIEELLKRLYSWDGIITATKSIDGLNKEEIIQSKSSLLFFRRILGENFISPNNRENELVILLSANIDHEKRYLIDLADFLSTIEAQVKFLRLISNLKAKSSETLVEIKLMNKFQKGGFNIEIYPEAYVHSKLKEADIKIVNTETKEEIIGEISVLNQNYRQKQAGEIFNRISEAIHNASNSYEISFAFLLHTNIAKKPLKNYLNTITEMVKRVSTNGNFEKLEIENHFKLGISMNQKSPEYLNWCKKNKIEPNAIREDYIDENEIVRIEIKINEEMKQLPITEKCLLMINSEHFFFRSMNLKQTITDLQQMIFDKSNIIALIISSNYSLAFNQNKIKKIQDTYLIQDNRSRFGGWYLIIWNSYSD